MAEKETLKFVNKSTNADPCFADEGSSGFDLRAWITEDNGGILTERFNKETKSPYRVYCVTLKPLERKMIHTGLYFEVPDHAEIHIRPRSGISLKKGLSLINSPGTVDASYTGECCALVVNLSNEDVCIENGERIVQAVMCPVFNGHQLKLKKIDKITKKTERGSGGFGHSGTK